MRDRARKDRGYRLVLESLEQRILLGADPFIDPNGTLVVQGTGAVDSAIIELAGPEILVTLNGQAFGFDKLLVNDISVSTMGGVDSISIDAAIDVASVVDGGNEVGVDDHLTIVGTSARDSFDIGPFVVRGRGATPTDVSFTNINFVDVLGMGGSDAFFVTPDLIAIAIDGGSGDDEVTIDAGGEISSTAAGPPLTVTVGSFTPIELSAAENIVVRNAPFFVGNAAAIDSGLSELVAWAQRLEGFGVFGVNAPLALSTHGELLGLSSVLEQLRVDLGAFLGDPGTPSPPTSADILSFLNTWSATPTPGLSVSAIATSSGFYVDPGAVVRPLVSLRMQSLSTTTVSLADAPGLEASGIEFDSSAMVTLTTALDMDFSFGAGVGALIAELVDMSITQSADASGVAAGTPVTIGILGATVSNPVVSLSGAVDVVARQHSPQ